MSMNTQRMRVVRTVLAALALAAATVVGVAAPASAHDSLSSSTPAAGETLAELPSEFSISTDEAMLDVSGTGSGFALQVLDADGRYFGDGCLTIAGTTMSTPAALGGAGDYTIVWQAVSVDGHTVSDEFDFTWSPPAGFEPASGSATAPVCGGAGATPDAPAATESSLVDVLWIGGVLVAIAIAAVTAIAFLGRRKGSGATTP